MSVYYNQVPVSSCFLLLPTSTAGKARDWPGQWQSIGEMPSVIITRVNEETADQMGVYYLSN